MNIQIDNKCSLLADISKQASTLDHFTIYHTKQWCNVIEDTFGWEVKTITAYDNNKLVFFLPYVSKLRLDFKRHNIALPLSHNLGPAYRPEYVPKLSGIFDKINEIGDFEIHNRVPSDKLIHESDHTLTILELEKFGYIDKVFAHLDKSSIQRKIVKAEKGGIVIKKESGLDSFISFCKLQNITRKRQGSPSYPKSFFKNLHKHFGGTDYLSLFLAYYRNKPVAGVIFFHFKGRSIYAYGASLNDRDLLQLGVNQAVMWEAIKDSYDRGFSLVDFGKTPNSLKSLKKYKEKWGTKTVSLVYSYTSDRSPQHIDRDGVPTKIASWILRKSPNLLFSKLSPYLLSIVS